jgi:ABC-type transporter MlaC component
MQFRRLSILVSVAGALSCVLVTTHARADVAGAQTFVEQRHGVMKKLVADDAPADRVRDAIDAMVDYDELAQRTLGNPCPPKLSSCTNHWDTLAASQRTEVTGLLRQLVERNFRKNLIKTKSYDVSYRGAKEQGENLSKVRTEAKSKEQARDAPIQVDYVILANGDRYKAVDVITEGSSMTKNYYDQLTRMLNNPQQGWPHLVQKLKDKIAAKDKAEEKEAKP